MFGRPGPAADQGPPGEPDLRHRGRVGGARRHLGDRLDGAAHLPHHVRLLRRLPYRPAVPQRHGRQRRVPLGRLLPRHRRTRRRTGRRDALVPRRLRRRLSRPARVRRRPAAPFRGLHPARLRRVPAGVQGRPARRRRARRRCRMALPAAPAPGRGTHPRTGHRGTALARRRTRRRGRHPGRGRRRHAQHHLRPGVPVLPEAHRAPRARGLPGHRLARRPAPRPGRGRAAGLPPAHAGHRREHRARQAGRAAADRGDRRRGRQGPQRRPPGAATRGARDPGRDDVPVPARGPGARTRERRRPARRRLQLGGTAVRRQGRSPAVHDVRADMRHLPRHHGAAPRPRPLLHHPTAAPPGAPP